MNLFSGSEYIVGEVNVLTEYERINNIRRMANEISYQTKDPEYVNDIQRVRCALDYVSRSLGMLADLELDRLKGNPESDVTLAFIEMRVTVAYDFIMNPTKNDELIDPPKPYIK